MAVTLQICLQYVYSQAVVKLIQHLQYAQPVQTTTAFTLCWLYWPSARLLTDGSHKRQLVIAFNLCW